MTLSLDGVPRTTAASLVLVLGIIGAAWFHDWWIVGGVLGILLLCAMPLINHEFPFLRGATPSSAFASSAVFWAP
jgi:hypothetical protein